MLKTWAIIPRKKNRSTKGVNIREQITKKQMEPNLESSDKRKLSCSDVSKCFQLLESILDGENIADSQEILKEKMAKCQPCFEHFHLEQAIRDVLKTKCTKHVVPEELIQRIRQKIEETK
jgi:anti-sigma factor (TIGR02949 family)